MQSATRGRSKSKDALSCGGGANATKAANSAADPSGQPFADAPEFRVSEGTSAAAGLNNQAANAATCCTHGAGEVLESSKKPKRPNDAPTRCAVDEAEADRWAPTPTWEAELLRPVSTRAIPAAAASAMSAAHCVERREQGETNMAQW